MNYYDYLQQTVGLGCTNCKFVDLCDQGAGFTAMDEYGICPIDNIDSPNDFNNATFPVNNFEEMG